MHQFPCSMPQPRAVPVEDLLTAGLGPDEVFYPASTVLARCASSGCCSGPGQICAPIETRNVSLVFMVRHSIDRQRDRHHEIIHAPEHIKCACIDKVLVAKNSKLWARIFFRRLFRRFLKIREYISCCFSKTLVRSIGTFSSGKVKFARVSISDNIIIIQRFGCSEELKAYVSYKNK